MEIINCYWEQENLKRNVAEVVLSHSDISCIDNIVALEQQYNYIVVKVPMNMVEINFQLSNLGYTLIENQIRLSKNYNDFDFENKLIKRIYPHFDSISVVDENDLSDVISKITPNMFSTDRIYLDPHFGPRFSMRRYVNWMKHELNNEGIVISKLMYDGENIGFGMAKYDSGIVHGIVGGIYEEYQKSIYGVITASRNFLIAKKNNIQIKSVQTAISSNNTPVLRFYNYLNYTIDEMKYVFIKHIS